MGRKYLIPLNQQRLINVSRYDELRVVHPIKDIVVNHELANLLPEQKKSTDLQEIE